MRDRLPMLGRVLVAAGLVAGCASSSPPPEAPPAPAPELAEAAPSVPAARYTVRLYAGDDAALADDLASRARERLEEPITVAGVAGEYRVEAGEFPTEAEARTFLAVARERGFPSANVRRVTAPEDGRSPKQRP